MKKSQYTHITRIADVGSDFKDCCITTHHEKFRVFLPDFHINDANFKGNQRKLIREWWRFAGKSVLANIKYRKGNFRAFEMSQARY